MADYKVFGISSDGVIDDLTDGEGDYCWEERQASDAVIELFGLVESMKEGDADSMEVAETLFNLKKILQ